jgi:hypothetical protein
MSISRPPAPLTCRRARTYSASRHARVATNDAANVTAPWPPRMTECTLIASAAIASIASAFTSR